MLFKFFVENLLHFSVPLIYKQNFKKPIIKKKNLKAFLNKQILKSKNGKQSLCQKYLPNDVWLWLQKSTKYGTTLVECVNSAIENPDSPVGLFAPDPDCYDTFPEVFWPVISDYHKVDVNSMKANNDFGDLNSIYEFEPKYSESIVLIRASLARSLSGLPMGPKLTRETRETIKMKALNAFKNLQDDFYGDYFELNELSCKERDNLIRTNYLFSDADDAYLRSAGAYTDWLGISSSSHRITVFFSPIGLIFLL